MRTAGGPHSIYSKGSVFMHEDSSDRRHSSLATLRKETMNALSTCLHGISSFQPTRCQPANGDHDNVLFGICKPWMHCQPVVPHNYSSQKAHRVIITYPFIVGFLKMKSQREKHYIYFYHTRFLHLNEFCIWTKRAVF